MKTSLSVTLLALVLAACGSAQSQTKQANAPVQTNATLTGGTVCVTGGLVPADESMVDYGTTYTPDMDGPAPAAPDKRVVNCNEAHHQGAAH